LTSAADPGCPWRGGHGDLVGEVADADVPP
jgi:hypothetical protein